MPWNELGIDGVSQQMLATGGLKVVTTISRPAEVELYKAVDENLDGKSISGTAGATVTSLPPWALVGAELQDPKTGEIVAEYPGKGENVGVRECDDVCQDNTASQTREQAGSAFTPYVLAAAVNQGMNVQTSMLDTSPYACIRPDGSSGYSQPITAGIYQLAGIANGCSSGDEYKIENNGGALIGKPAGGPSAGSYSDNVQDSLAQSSNTAVTDLAHRVTTASIISTAREFGVNTAAYPQGSSLVNLRGDVGMALGIASLTVQEQASMLSAIADGGTYHQAHLVRYWQQGASGPQRRPKVGEHVVLKPNLDADVQYAMERTTIDGTAAQTVTFGRNSPSTVIGKTGTTANDKSGSFIGATSQYSLVVDMFTASPASPGSLAELGGGGFGAYWPAKIWNTFAEAEFSTSAQTFPTNPAFYGTAWNMLGA